jgi:hypothetical protein
VSEVNRLVGYQGDVWRIGEAVSKNTPHLVSEMSEGIKPLPVLMKMSRVTAGPLDGSCSYFVLCTLCLAKLC